MSRTKKHKTAPAGMARVVFFALPAIDIPPEMGFLRRVHGGAVLTTGSTFDTPASLRRTQELLGK